MERVDLRPFLVLTCAAAAAIAACSGGQPGRPVPAAGSAAAPAGVRIVPTFPSTTFTAAPPDVPIASANMPAPFDPESPAPNLGRTALKRSTARFVIPLRFLLQRNSVATAPPNDHEAVGTFMFANNENQRPPYTAIFSVQSAYEALQNPLPYPMGASGPETIFVPTTHMGWGSCLETGTQYQDVTPPNSTTAEYYVFDFCTKPATFLAWYDIDAAFLTSYVRYIGRGKNAVGAQAYVTETFTPDAHPNRRSQWYSLLYNFTTGQYDVMGTDRPHAGVQFSRGAFGWSVTEPYAPAGPCPQIAPAALKKLELYDAKRSAWQPLTPTLARGAYSYIGFEASSPNSCILGSPSGNPTLLFDLLKPNDAWTTVSPREPSGS